MARGRFILRYLGKGRAPAADAARVRGLEDAVVIDTTSRMLLVECDEETLKAFVDEAGDWALSPERQYAVPDPRPKVERPPDGVD